MSDENTNERNEPEFVPVACELLDPLLFCAASVFCRPAAPMCEIPALADPEVRPAHCCRGEDVRHDTQAEKQLG
jgi:hypothetical protein